VESEPIPKRNTLIVIPHFTPAEIWRITHKFFIFKIGGRDACIPRGNSIIKGNYLGSNVFKGNNIIKENADSELSIK
jgi:hypothetical protein